MAYEGSEIATAAALMFSTEELSKLKAKFKGRNVEDVNHLQEAIKTAIKRITGKEKGKRVGEVVFGPGGAKVGFMKILDPKTNPKPEDALNDFAKGISAAISIRSYIRGKRGDTSPTKKVFMTGGTWPAEVEKFSLREGQFNYNSADILINNSIGTKKEKYYGISLKKKSTKKAASPPLINKSLEKLLNESGDFKELLKELDNFKHKYFADNLKKIITNKKGSLGKGGKLLYIDFPLPTGDKELFNCTIKNPYKTGKNIRLISLKGMGVVRKNLDRVKDKKLCQMLFAKDKNDKAIPKAQWQTRQYMNKTLYGGSANPYWQEVLKILNSKSGVLAERLVDLILKVNLYTKLKEKDITKADFDFALTEGIGNVTPKGDVSIADATTYPIKTFLCGYTRIQNHTDLKDKDWKLVVKEKKEENSEIEEEEIAEGTDRAQIKFWLMKGEQKVLNLTLRYKGKLGTPPQFTGTLHPKFAELLKEECG